MMLPKVELQYFIIWALVLKSVDVISILFCHQCNDIKFKISPKDRAILILLSSVNFGILNGIFITAFGNAVVAVIHLMICSFIWMVSAMIMCTNPTIKNNLPGEFSEKHYSKIRFLLTFLLPLVISIALGYRLNCLYLYSY